MRLLRYNQEINTFRVEDALNIFSSSFLLTPEEEEEVKELLTFYYLTFSKGYGLTKNYWSIQSQLKEVKETCQRDWDCWMKRDLTQVSSMHKKLFSMIAESPRPQSLKDNICHTAVRIGEFYYITDQEMEELASNMSSFIESGDCKLFDYEGSPYGDIPLEDTLEEDIHKKADRISEFLKSKNMKILKPNQITDALKKIREWVLSDVKQVPKWARGYIQVCQEIKKSMALHHKDFEELRTEGISDKLIIQKRSGFCLNKEGWFREFLERTSMPTWKNPEGSWIAGSTNLPIPEGVYKDTYSLPQWIMDCIYYSLGKGPWLKTRYVGQPCAFFQNIAELGASIVKFTIKNHERKRKEALEAGEPTDLEDASGINIYENYDSLKDMVVTMKDSVAVDFSSYSDYLSRNTFKWIMDYLWGMPKWYSNIIMGMMSLPIKVNGQIYPHLHGSVMGIKLNFLLITFANMVMWMVSNIISECEDKAKFMGDDRISVKSSLYSLEEFSIALSVTAYFNCVVNADKTEWLQRDGYTSFCKRTFNKDGEQISGLGGEYLLKQKPFLNDLSVWESICYRNDIPLSEPQLKRWFEHWSPYYLLTYVRFQRPDDPDLDQMVKTMRKIPFCYGGWSLEATTGDLDQIMLRSVMATINTIMEEVKEDQSSPGLNRIREYIRANGGENNRYYLNLMNSSSYTLDYDKIQGYLQDITRVLSKPNNTLEEMKRARSASQRIMEIILERDSRLASSSSTKNRINYTFDQDRVAKIRTKYIRAAFEETEHNLKSGVIDQAVLEDCLSQRGNLGIQDYLKYLEHKTKCDIVTGYYSNFCTSFYGMKVVREHPDGSGKRVFWKRIEADDTQYGHIYEKNGKYCGDFVTEKDLTEDEKYVYKMLRSGKTRDIVEQLDRILERQMRDMKDYLLSNLLDCYDL